MTVRYAGIGETLGDDLVTQARLYVGGTIRFAHYGTGSDANVGTDKEAPLKTLGAAISAASAGDMIVLLDGHEEVLTTAQTPAAGVVIVGSGRASGKPTVKLGFNNAANANLFIISAAGVELRNLWLQGNSQANSGARVIVSAAGFRMEGCYVECGQFDDQVSVSLGSGADRATLASTTFISTADSVSARPNGAVKNTAAIADLRLDGVVFDGGSYGFSGLALNAPSADITRLKGEGVSLLRNANVFFTATTTGYFQVGTVSGGSSVQWAI